MLQVRPLQDVGPATAFDLSADEVRVMADAGYAAIRTNRIKLAREIFEGLVQFRPNAVCSTVGLALVLMAEGRHAEAANLLENAERRQPDPDRLLPRFQALAILMGGDASGCARLAKQLGAPAAGPLDQSSGADGFLRELRVAATASLSPADVAWRRMSSI